MSSDEFSTALFRLLSEMVDQHGGCVTLQVIFNSHERDEVPISDEDLRLYEGMLSEDDPGRAFAAAAFFRAALNDVQAPPVKQVIQAGLLPRFVALLSNDFSQRLREEAAWVLTALAQLGDEEDVAAVMSCTGIVNCLQFISLPPNGLSVTESSDVGASSAETTGITQSGPSDGSELCSRCLQLVGQMASTPEHRDQLIASGAVGVLTGLVRAILDKPATAKPGLLRLATAAAASLVSGHPKPYASGVAPLLPLFARLIAFTDTEVAESAGAGLAHLGDIPQLRFQIAMCTVEDEEGKQHSLIEATREAAVHDSQHLLEPLLHLWCRLNTGDAVTRGAIVEGGVLPILIQVAGGDVLEAHRKDAWWALGNLAVGTPGHLRALVDAGVVSLLAQSLRQESSVSVFGQSLCVLRGIGRRPFQGKREVLLDMLNAGVLSAAARADYVTDLQDAERLVECFTAFILAFREDTAAVERCLEAARPIVQPLEQLNATSHSLLVREFVERYTRPATRAPPQ